MASSTPKGLMERLVGRLSCRTGQPPAICLEAKHSRILILKSTSVSDFESNILKNEPALQQYAGKADWHYFPYPYLHERETLEKRQAIQSFLKDHGYRTAEVSLDFEDYLWNDPCARCTAKQRMDKVDALHDSYLAAADQYINVYRSLAHRLYGYDIPCVLLLHVTAFNAKMLPDLIAQLRERGFTFITLPGALSDPAYRIDPAIGYPGGVPSRKSWRPQESSLSLRLSDPMSSRRGLASRLQLNTASVSAKALVGC